MSELKRIPRTVAPGEVLSRWRPWIVVRSTEGRRLIIYWQRTLGYLAALGLLAWCGAAGGALVLLHSRHPGAEISYWNLVFPFRWSEHRRALGRHYLRLGEQALAERRIGDALRFLSAGVARVPDDVAARRKLAGLFVAVRQPQRAAGLLEAGLAAGRADPEYLRLTFGLLAETEQDAAILSLADRLLPAQPDRAAPADAVIALQAAQASRRLGDYDGAESRLKLWRLAGTVEGEVELAQLELDRGYPELALLRLQQARDHFPLRDEASLALIRALHAAGRTGEALNEAVRRVTANPSSPGARMDVVRSLRLHGEPGRAEAEAAAFLRDHAADPRALSLLAQYAVELPDSALADRVVAAAREGRFPLPRFRLAAIDCRLREGRWREAQAQVEEATADPDGSPGYRNLLAGFRAVAAAGLREASAADGFLAVFANGRPAAGEALAVAHLLRQAGEPARARHLLAALPGGPANQAVATQLVRLDLETGDLAALEADLPALLRARRPARELLREAYLRLDDSSPARAALRRDLRAALEAAAAGSR